MLFRQPFAAVLLALLLLAASALPTLAQEGDVAGSADPSVLGKRFPGARIVAYETQAFDEHLVVTGPIKKKDTPEASERIEGKVTIASYEISKDRTVLEVFRNYENALKEAGFETLYSCVDKACGGRTFNHAIAPYSGGYGENYNGQRYIAAKLARPEGAAYVTVYVVKNYSVGGKTKDLVYARVAAVETKAMETALVKVSAKEMAEKIAAEGGIALYGIHFDTDSASIKPESDETIAEIAKLLQKAPTLSLLVVGHTDNQGKLGYNRDLSQRRAQAVVEQLTTCGIADARLEAHGVGFLAPVASNDSEQGRALNRRVVLVPR
ncbi:MAG: DUF4892 domain-containing protein [Kiloniellales bacterium]